MPRTFTVIVSVDLKGDFIPSVKSTSDNNANRKGSSDTYRSEHPKIVCSTCNVRPYDVSRASWKFFPFSPLALVGISFAKNARRISRDRDDWNRVYMASFLPWLSTKYLCNTIDSSTRWKIFQNDEMIGWMQNECIFVNRRLLLLPEQMNKR